jgi:hypothetical protein
MMFVMAGLDPAIHVLRSRKARTWMPGIADKFTRSAQGGPLWPGMTSYGVLAVIASLAKLT